jgi:DNA-binding NtrC family response regulator/tetratricopeptide (TPR) repeat protein
MNKIFDRSIRSLISGFYILETQRFQLSYCYTVPVSRPMSTSPSPSPRPSVVAGRYSILRKLGSGSLGSVYMARDEEAGRMVALKLIRKGRPIPQALGSMQEEFRAIARIDHPRIARAYDFGYTEAEIPFYTREYIQGVPLPPGPPGKEAPARFLRPILDLLDALDVLHAQGVLHLDIHAGNLIVADEEARGSVLIDIGLFRSMGETLTSRPDSWSSLPPELLDGREPEPRTDIFLAGRLLHHRLTGRTVGRTSLPREIPGWGARLTLELERMIAKATAASPEGRFASAAEFRAVLHKALGDSPAASETIPLDRGIAGRTTELERIEEVLRTAAAGSTAVLWLASRPGLGKTRLLSEAKLRAQLRNLPAIDVRFLPDPGPGPALPDALARAGRRGGSSWLESLDPRCGGTPRERAARAAAACLQEEAKASVLLLDDADLADRASRDLLEALVAECLEPSAPPRRGLALFVAASTPPSSRSVPRKLQANTCCILKPLDGAGSRDLFLALLEPLAVPPSVVKRALRLARGSPRSLLSIARALRADWTEGGVIPETARLPAPAPDPRGAWFAGRRDLARADRRILEVLAVAGRSATGKEIAAAAELPAGEVERGLRRLSKVELVTGRPSGRGRRHQLTRPDDARRIAACLSPERRREIHSRLGRFLRDALAEAGAADPRDRENLARHLLALGRRSEGLREAVRASRLLRAGGLDERAAGLLEEALAVEKDRRRRWAIAEELCEILAGRGDHEKAIEVLEPFYREESRGGPSSRKVRARRILGYNYHRAGLPRKALRVFRDAQAIAVPGRDREDLAFIDSELAEIHNFLGRHDEAEEDCRRGLARLEEIRRRDGFRRRMEVLFQASLGHIEMRRMRLPEARDELAKALALSRGQDMLGDRAAILHNLAIVLNQMNDLVGARRTFREAERLLRRTGKEREAIKIFTNLSLIEAKLGRREAARAALARASEMLRRYPGQRLDCFVAYSKGLTAHLLGEMEPAIACLEEASSLARDLGDVSVDGFARIHLAEAHLFSGRYGKALDLFREVLGDARKASAPVLERMALCRIALAEALLGREEASASLEAAEGVRSSDVRYLEAWNDLFVGLAGLLCGRLRREAVERARADFDGWGVEAGARSARLLLLLDALSRKDLEEIPALVPGGAEEEPASLLVRVAEPLAAAEASFALGDLERADAFLTAASVAIVGLPFLELDLRIELSRARLAARRGNRREARRHLHRSSHTMDLLLQLVPEEDRERFARAPRFEALRELSGRLAPAAPVEIGTERLERSCIYEGLVGRSPVMLDLFRTLDRLAEQELPVLITGETGTGKDLVARAIHRRSLRRDGPLQVVSCACLPSELFESELFGHAAGAFSGAEREQQGLLEAASGGTLVLDHVDLLPLEPQAKLLRVLDSGAFRRLGSPGTRRTDVRIVATSGSDLRGALEAGGFRTDLFYRLAGVELRLPPLRDRPEDIPQLAAHFLEEHAARLDRPVPALEPEALALLSRHRWPGNVRELEMLLLGLLVKLPDARRIGAADLEPLLAGRGPSTALSPGGPLPGGPAPDLLSRSLPDIRREIEREYLTQLFRKLGGDVGAMTRELHVKITKLYLWLRDLGIDTRALRRELKGKEEGR